VTNSYIFILILKLVRITTGYVKWGHKRNEDILDKIQTGPVIA